MQGHATHELHVVVTLTQHASGAFAHDGVRLDQQIVQGLALGDALAEYVGLGPQLGVGESGHLSREFVDGSDEFGELTTALAFTGLENLLEHTHDLSTLPVREKA